MLELLLLQQQQQHRAVLLLIVVVVVASTATLSSWKHHHHHHHAHCRVMRDSDDCDSVIWCSLWFLSQSYVGLMIFIRKLFNVSLQLQHIYFHLAPTLSVAQLLSFISKPPNVCFTDYDFYLKNMFSLFVALNFLSQNYEYFRSTVFLALFFLSQNCFIWVNRL